jgi:hypothetical protein
LFKEPIIVLQSKTNINSKTWAGFLFKEKYFDRIYRMDRMFSGFPDENLKVYIACGELKADN